MSLSKALLGWKGNLTTFIPADYVLMLRMDMNAFSDAAKELELENDELRAENEKLRELLVESVDVADAYYYCGGVKDDLDTIKEEMRELGIEAG